MLEADFSKNYIWRLLIAFLRYAHPNTVNVANAANAANATNAANAANAANTANATAVNTSNAAKNLEFRICNFGFRIWDLGPRLLFTNWSF